jgi:hypothetical protein
METQESNSNTKLTTFSQDEATPSNISQGNEKQSGNILNKDIVSRPLLWGLVVFLVFFALVIGGVSVYRMYQANNSISDSDNISNTTETTTQQTTTEVNNLPVTTDTTKEASIVESEIKAIDSDLEGDIYSDESLGL